MRCALSTQADESHGASTTPATGKLVAPALEHKKEPSEMCEGGTAKGTGTCSWAIYEDAG
jgi:hypothetical protein